MSVKKGKDMGENTKKNQYKEKKIAEELSNKGVNIAKLGRYDEAINFFDKALEVFPNFAEVWTNKGTILEKLKRYDEAIECYNRGIELSPKADKAWSNKGSVLSKLGKYDEAIECFDKAIYINPNYSISWYNKGVTLTILGKYDEAIESYDKAIEINPAYVDALSNKGIALARLGKYEEAIKCYNKAIEINPNDAGAWSNKGIALKDLGKYEEAIKCYNKAIKINPNSEIAWSNKGVILGILGKHEEALKHFDKAIKINPNYAEAWSNKGVTLGALGKRKAEVKCYNRAIKINSDYAKAWYNKGVALAIIGNDEEAIKCYDRILKIKPNYIEAWSNKGAALSNLEKYEEAIKCYNRAIKINPNSEIAWYNKGVALNNLGNYEEAIKCYNRAITIKPNFAESYGNKGVVFLNVGRYNEAIDELTQAKKLFSKIGYKRDIKRAHELIKFSEFALKLNSLDREFKDSLNSSDLIELKADMSQISEKSKDIVERFKEEDMHDHIKNILVGKSIYFNTLLHALNFEKIDLNKLERTKKLFERSGFDEFVIMVNSLDNFIHFLSKYKSLDEIPKKEQKTLLKNILQTPSVLYNELFVQTTYKTERILFFPAKQDIEEDFRVEPEIISIKIADKSEDWVRVCLVQLDFSVEYIKSRTEFGYVLTDKKIIRKKIFDALQIAKTKNVNIICFPELSVVEDWLEEVRNQYNDMITVFGTYYSDSFNICPIIVNGKKVEVRKINPSPIFEIKTGPGRGMKSGNKFPVFHTNFGNFVVLICWDYIKEGYRFLHERNEITKMIDFIIIPEHNEKIDFFQKQGDLDCQKGNCPYIIQINAWKIDSQEVGGTCVIGTEHKEMLKRYITEGKKPPDNIEYKLIQKEGECMIIVDLDIKRKGVPIPASGPKMVLVGHYQYRNGEWKKEN